MVAQVFVENKNRKGCPSRFDTPGTGIVKGVWKCSSPGSRIGQTALSPEKGSADAHACACRGQYSVYRATLDYYTWE